MDVFTTKSGKVYKVSLRNFNAATDKKAPYYKRVKIDGRVVEKAYAICPGCGNPVHFVNLFNKKKQKKAHARHQRSSVKGLANYSASAYKGCPYVLGIEDTKKSSAPAKQEKKDPSKEITAFSAALESAFGFSSKNTNLLAEMYSVLNKQNPETASQKFFALMASASYNNLSLELLFKSGPKEAFEQFWKGLAWDVTGNIDHFESAKNYLVSLGFGKSETDELFKELATQHNKLDDPNSQYFNKLDFTHLCATAAANLYESQIKAVSDLDSGIYTGIFSTNASAGYIGDLCGTDGIPPSMNNGDYKADLDAVNLVALLQKDQNKSLSAIMTTYLNDVESDSINRAVEFKKNISIDTLISQRNAYKTRLEQANIITDQIEGPFLTYADAIKEESFSDKLKLFDKFINHIRNNRNEWSDD